MKHHTRDPELDARVRAKIEASGGKMSEVEALLELVEDCDRESRRVMADLRACLAGCFSPPPPPAPVQPTEPAPETTPTTASVQETQHSVGGVAKQVAKGERKKSSPQLTFDFDAPPTTQPIDSAEDDMNPTATKKALAKIPQDVKDVLTRATITPESLTLPPGQLAPALYKACMKVVEAYGGKWNRKKGHHVLPEGAAEKIETALERGAFVREKVLFQAFYTPAAVALELAEWMLEGAVWPNSASVLEPSCGEGALIKAVIEAATGKFRPRFTAFDLNPEMIARLQRPEAFNHEVVAFDRLECADFASLPVPETPPARFIAMNPPFTGGQDMAHVRLAFDWLAPGGVLCAIMSPAFTFHTSTAATEFRNWFQSLRGETREMEEGSFAESGTAVRTVMVKIAHPQDAHGRYL